MADIISERIVEDILSADKSILSELISANPANLSLLARQKAVSSGKLDLLYLYENDLILIELKVVEFYREIIRQINDYHRDLLELQRQHRLIDTSIRKVVLVTGFNPKDQEACASQQIELVAFRPEEVLGKYYENFKEMTSFLRIRSGDFGVVRLALLKPSLRLVAAGRRIREISDIEEKSEKTVKNRMSVAALLGLVAKYKGDYFLTDFGSTFMETDEKGSDDRLSSGQVQLLSDFVKQSPFYSSITYTIFAILESAFVLAKSAYPVSAASLRDYFVKSVGKEETWRTKKARETATYIFTNYACELEFLVKVSNHFYLTPKGIQAILLLQLNRSIKLIESQK